MSDRQVASQGDFGMGGLTSMGNSGSANPDLSWQERALCAQTDPRSEERRVGKEC